MIQAYGVPDEPTSGQIVQANFADAQFNAAVTDLEQILRDERDRLDPRTVLIIERNLKAIDAAINEARMALNNDPANPYLEFTSGGRASAQARPAASCHYPRFSRRRLIR